MAEAVARALERHDPSLYAYSPALGLPELREAVAEDLRSEGVGVEASQVAVVPGSTAGIYFALAAILDPGDEVVLTDPTFMMYEPVVASLGGRVRYVRSRPEDGFQPDVEAIKEAVGERTKAIIVVDPDNPTGRVLSPEASRALAEVAEDAGAYLIVDEAYRTFVYEGRRSPPARYGEGVVGIGTFSKDPGVPGLRVGYVYGPAEVVEGLRLLAEHAYFGASNLSQLFALEYLRWPGRRAFLERVVAEYRARRDAMGEALAEMLPGARFERPKGALYYFVDLSAYAGDSEALARELAARHGVTVMPGTAFGRSYRSWVRLTFAAGPPEVLREGVRRIAQALAPPS